LIWVDSQSIACPIRSLDHDDCGLSTGRCRDGDDLVFSANDLLNSWIILDYLYGLLFEVFPGAWRSLDLELEVYAAVLAAEDF